MTTIAYFLDPFQVLKFTGISGWVEVPSSLKRDRMKRYILLFNIFFSVFKFSNFQVTGQRQSEAYFNFRFFNSGKEGIF